MPFTSIFFSVFSSYLPWCLHRWTFKFYWSLVYHVLKGFNLFERQKRGRSRELSSTGSKPVKGHVVRAAPSQSQEPGSSCWSPKDPRVAGSQELLPSSAAFSGALAESWITSRAAGNQTAIQDTSVIGNSLTYSTTMPPPPDDFWHESCLQWYIQRKSKYLGSYIRFLLFHLCYLQGLL